MAAEKKRVTVICPVSAAGRHVSRKEVKKAKDDQRKIYKGLGFSLKDYIESEPRSVTESGSQRIVVKVVQLTLLFEGRF